ncbi:hypothetical protein B0H16DRAFT_1696410 [Mycena metata]|uniref:Uncharacterized protein n=1 Tax=Mycena metata TaxID=1033252 RepID=A0AAD7I0N8_9AGAR|nr:hypothetical protein B0H16DRAFT_1696410 [Mycena metata]
MTTGRHRAATAFLVIRGRRRGGAGSFCICGCDGGVRIQGVEVWLRVLRFHVLLVVGFSADGSSKQCEDQEGSGLVEFGKNAPALRLEEYRQAAGNAEPNLSSMQRTLRGAARRMGKPDDNETDTDVGLETVLNVAEDGNGAEEDGP